MKQCTSPQCQSINQSKKFGEKKKVNKLGQGFFLLKLSKIVAPPTTTTSVTRFGKKIKVFGYF